MTTTELLLYLGTSVVFGAVIGYVTNALAIKMLFRPYNPVYFLGLRLPFTPGIIPRQRDKMASAVATVVRAQLFNAQAIGAHLDAPESKERLAEGVRWLLQLASGHRTANFDGHGPPWLQEILGSPDTRRRFLEALVAQVLANPGFARGLGNTGTALGGIVDQLTLSSLVPQEADREALVKALYESQGREDVAQVVEGVVVTIFDAITMGEKPLGAIIAPPTKEDIAGFLNGFWDPLVDTVMVWLRSPTMEQELVSRGRALLGAAFTKLSGTQRFFAGLGGYDKRLDQAMPQLVLDALQELEQSLRGTALKTTIAAFLHARLVGLLAKTPAHAMESLGFSPIQVRGWLVGVSKDFVARTSLPSTIVRGLWEWASQDATRTLGSVYRSLTGRGLHELGQFLAQGLAAWVRAPGTFTQVWDLVLAMTTQSRLASTPTEDAPLVQGEPEQVQAEQVTQADHGTIEELTDYLTRALTRGMAGVIPWLLDRFDLEGLVQRRIKSLSMKEVESLVLSLSKRELQWINILGAILGGIIGVAQVVVNLIISTKP